MPEHTPADPDGAAQDALPVDPDVTAADLPAAPAARLAGTLLLISAGGVVGTVGRYWVSLGWPTPPGAVPWPTLAINAVGSALLGCLVGAGRVRPAWARWRPLLGTGVLGGFTTFSSFAVENERLLRAGHAGLAISYAVVSVMACAAAAGAGEVLIGRALTGRMTRPHGIAR